MSASHPDLNNLLGIDKDDLLTAMKKLTKIIQSDKQFDVIPNHQPNQHFSSPARINSKTYQTNSPLQTNENYEEAELIEGLKNVANEIANFNVKNDMDESMLRTRRNQNDQSANHSYKTHGISYEKERRAGKSPNIVDRLYDLENKKREKIAALQFQRYKEELATLKQKPEISLNSKIIAEQKHKTPIYERSLAIMKQREENINKIRRELEETREEIECSPTFQPDLSCTRRHKYERSRTPQEFTAQVYAWQQKKNEAIQKEQYENITRELSELTFKPKINHKSRVIAEKINTGEPVESRLQKHKDIIEAKKQGLLEKEKPTFKPILNERSQNLTKHRKATCDKSYRYDKSANLSIMDASHAVEDNRRVTPTQGRSLSPGPLVKPRSGHNVSGYMQKSPKFNEIDYTPAIDFLLRKLE